MADILDPGSPHWWLHRLAGQLALDQPRMVLMDRYYRGNHPLPSVPNKLKAEYKVMLKRSRSNFMRIVVEAPAERLRVQGFRAEGATEADQDDWKWWLDNGMDVGANLAIVDSMSMARSYLSVWKFNGEDDARVQVEDPRNAIVEHDQVNRRKRAAGLRLWVDDWTSRVRADVWLPDGCYRFISGNKRINSSHLWPEHWQPAYPVDDDQVTFTDMVQREEPAKTLSEWLTQWVELDRVPNPIKEIPLVPLVNRPSVLKQPDGESEIDDVYLTQDRINEMLFNRALAAWTTAYRQKWATGLDIPTDDDGNAVQPYEAAIDRLWVSESEGTKFGEFGATDLKPYIESIEEDVQHVAVQTRTPRHYFLQQGQSPSGDAIKSAEAGLVAKVMEKQAHLGPAFAEVVRLRHLLTGGETRPVETIWADPEFRTLAELTDAVIKQHAAKLIPTRVAQEKLGFSPSEIERMERLAMQEAVVADAARALEPEPVDEELDPADART